MASVRETPTNTFRVLYRHGGKQSSKTFTGRKDAERFRSMVDALGPDRALEELLSDTESRITVGEIATQFLAWKKTGAKKVTDRTLADYARDIDNWIVPWFGHRAAVTITEADVQAWVDHMGTKLSPKSVVDRHMLLHSVYEYGRARTRRLVDHNPCKETELPRAARKPPKGTTVSEFRAILDAAEKRNPDARDLILFLGSTGWRWSEAAALGVRDVDDNGDGVHVTVSRVFRKDGNQRQVLVEGAAKSWAGFRRTPLLFDEVTATVRRRVVGKAPGDFVFTNSRGRHWSQATFLRDTWPAIIKNARLDREPTPHWLRHMAVGVLHAAGVDLVEIQRMIGHEHITTTMGTYGGMVGGSISTDARAAVNQIMAGRGPTGALVVGTVLELDG